MIISFQFINNKYIRLKRRSGRSSCSFNYSISFYFFYITFFYKFSVFLIISYSLSINYCYNPGTIDSYCIGKGGEGCTFCAYGCSEGACLPGTSTSPSAYPCGQGTDGKQCTCLSSPAQKIGCTYSPVYENNKCITGYKEICESNKLLIG